MGGTCVVQEEPGKQKPRSCRAQELARSSAQGNEREKKATQLTRGQLRMKRRPGASNSADYSKRKATIGSTRDARRAGI
jgi:hypothetical protein